jgi:hypothetical protein
LRENFKAALSLSEDAVEHIEHLPRTVSTVELPGSGDMVCVVLLSGDRIYTEVDKTLYVYCMSDLNSPIATYDLPANCLSGLVTDN